jgi:group II intron reverse transcriptase/maturase
MTETQSSQDVSTKLERIAKLAKEKRGVSLQTLAHHMDVNWLREAYRRTRKDGARGVDGQSAGSYAVRLEANLQSLLDRAKSGRYWAPPVRRVHIPKGDGAETRPIGIPTFEDKVLQRAVAMMIGEVYEQEFHDFSYGFRPGRSPHQALRAVHDAVWRLYGGWIVEVDIRKFFDTVDHSHLQEILRRRIGDGVLLRLIGKWLNAGVIEGLELSYSEEGTPQGGVISPLLANIYLHEVLDEWFVRDVLPALTGHAEMFRFADDFVVLFVNKRDAERFLTVLPKRFGKYGLTLHPDKTRMLSFRRPDLVGDDKDLPGTFNFLGFTHYWGLSRKPVPRGQPPRRQWFAKQKTAKDRFSRTLRRFSEWCQRHRHDSLNTQHLMLVKKLRGHYGYYGITGNFLALARVFYMVKCIWRKALARRSQRRLPWSKMQRILARFPLPLPRIIHQHRP